MAAANSRTSTELLIPKKPKNNWNNHHHHHHHYVNGNGDVIVNNSSPERSPVWIEPKSNRTTAAANAVAVRKVPVLYYLTRNGHVEHPHLIEVPLSSPRGLYLRDVINTLKCHRGKGMANMYSWSFKRNYKSGYVWHDLSEDDLIQPTNGNDYVLKGSELLEPPHAPQNTPETTTGTGDDCSSSAAIIRRRNLSWSSFDNPQEYLVIKCESSRELAAKFAADAATQTEEQRLRRSLGEGSKDHVREHVTVELSREEMPSPPPSNSSSEVSEGVSGSMFVDQTASSALGRDQTVEDQNAASGRMKASKVLMHLITCGAGSARDVSNMRSKQDQRCIVGVEHEKSLRSEALNH